MSTVLGDRRRRRREQTVDEILTHALDVMSESGAAGLSLGEVARRMQIRTPSLYGYFPSKAAVYDEVFARGWRSFSATMQVYDAPPAVDAVLHEHLAEVMRGALDWAAAHPAYSQLMFWRPVPRWEPSRESYAEAERALELATKAFERLLRAGLLRRDVDLSEAVQSWAAMVAGLISQRLSNEPNVPAPDARSTALVHPLVSCFTAHYARSWS